MSFCYLASGIHNITKNELIVNVYPPIVLNDQYEVCISEIFFDEVKRNVGILRINNIDFNLSHPFSEREEGCKLLNSELGLTTCFDKDDFWIHMDQPFIFNNIESDENNDIGITLDNDKTIFIFSNIVENSRINGTEASILKSFKYNGEKYLDKNIEYHRVKSKIIKKIILQFKDRENKSVYLLPNFQHFVLHFKKI